MTNTRESESKTKPSSQDRQRYLELRVHTPRNSSLGKTFEYLLESKEWTAKEGKTKVSQAISAFYLPEAQRLTNPEQARATAVQAIYLLESQIRKIRHEFGITEPTTQPTGTIHQMNSREQTAPEPIPRQSAPELVDIFSMEEMQALNDSLFE